MVIFCFDVETLGVESTSVILSYAIVYFDPEKENSYQDLLDNTLFAKLDVKDQIKNYGRTMDKPVMTWWGKQHDWVRKVSLDPSPNDMSVDVALDVLDKYISRFPNRDQQTFWARGTLDSACLESLCRSVGKEPIVPFNAWRDVRTAIDILYGTSNGYCDVDHNTFNRDNVIKHHPAHDVCYDVMMLLYGKQRNE